MTKQQIVEDNMNLVYSLIAKEYPTYLNDEDIIQCGMLGLCKAADKWDEEKGTFSTFAWFCIRNEIRQEFRSRSKHQNILSLDYEVDSEEGKTTFGDFVMGDEDVNYIDTSDLTEREAQVLQLLNNGLSQVVIAKKLGITKQRVWAILRKLKTMRG